MNEVLIEIGEAEEGLDVADLPRFGPILNDFDFGFIHSEAFGQEDVAEEFHHCSVKLALVFSGE